ncbi:9508_t:CDS:2, partial [Entrophospora sp. SA101]
MDVISIIEKITDLVTTAYKAYNNVKYFKKFSTAIYDRIEAGANRLNYLKRHQKKIKEKFPDENSIDNLQRYLKAVTTLTKLLVDFSELHLLNKYIKSINYKDKIIDQIKKYDEIINDLNLDINLENFETVENLNVLVEEGFNDVTQTLELMKKNMDNIGNNVDNLGSNMEFVMEMVAWISKNMEELSKKSDQPNFKSEFPDKVLDSCKLTDPPPGEDTLRGKVFKKLLNKVQPVACKPFEALTNEKEKELSKGYLTILSNLQHSKSVISFYGVSYVDEISQHIRKGHREYLNFESDEIQKCFKNIISTAWHQKPELRLNMPDILKRLEKLYKKNYFTKIKPHCEDITDS